ncbi:MAG: PPC domain-containing protein [Thermoanaerobaculia bacterium]
MKSLLTIALVSVVSLLIAMPANGACSGASTVACGASVNGSLGSGDCSRSTGGWFDRYAIFLNESERIVVEVQAMNPNLPLVVSLMEDDEEVFESNSGLGRVVVDDVAIDPMIVIIEVFTPNASGSAYTLTVSCPTGEPTCTWSGTLVCGESTAGELTSTDCPGIDEQYDDYYRVNLGEGQTITLTATADFALYLQIYRQGNTASEFEGAYATGRSEETISFTAPVDDVYGIRVGSTVAYRTGRYSLTTSCETTSCSRRRSVRH